MITNTRDPVEAIVGFTRRLDHAGVAVPATRVHAMLQALDALGAGSLQSVYWSGRVTLCGSPEDIDRYDRVFAEYFSGRPPRLPKRLPSAPSYRLAAVPSDVITNGDGARQEDLAPERLSTASRLEVLRHRDVADLTPADRAEVHRFINALLPGSPERMTRRLRPSSVGRVDPHRTVRAMLHHGGEPVELRLRRRVRRHRRLVFLIDVSGSMAPYADVLLRFAHAACLARPGTEVFTIGTRLTRVTRELRHREPSSAMRAAAGVVADWSGGTRLGEELKEFLDAWGQRGTARGAVVVIGSDGWERGDPTLLAAQAARLGRLARRVVWVNPHRGRQGFVPSTAGMRAALPYVDRLVAGHSLGAMEDLARILGEGGRDARGIA